MYYILWMLGSCICTEIYQIVNNTVFSILIQLCIVCITFCVLHWNLHLLFFFSPPVFLKYPTRRWWTEQGCTRAFIWSWRDGLKRIQTGEHRNHTFLGYANDSNVHISKTITITFVITSRLILWQVFRHCLG